MKTFVLLVVAAALTACGSRSPDPVAVEPSPTARPTAVPSAAGPVTATATVIDAGASGPELCLGAVMESLPPQCDGTPIRGWDWAAAGDHEHAAGVRFGGFTVIGTFDGTTFTLTEPPTAPTPEPGRGFPDLSTRCPEPEDGWRVVDPARTTQKSMQRVFAVASGLEGYAGAWMDQSINPAYDDPTPAETAMNDPELSVVNVQVTGDPAAAEAELREVWGGALCVTRAEHTEAELSAVQRELSELPGMLTSGAGFDRVTATVTYDDGSLQAWADAEYGPGLVEIDSALRPVGG